MATNWAFFNGAIDQYIRPTGPTSAGAGTIALDSAYTYASAGDAVFFGFIPQNSDTMTEFQLKVSSYTGTWANTDGVINVQIREGINGTEIPGTTLTGSFTVTLDGSTTGWIVKTGLSISLTEGVLYSVVVGDADGDASDYVTLAYRYGTLNPSLFAGRMLTTTNGFSTQGTNATGGAAFALKVGTHYYSGVAYDTVAAVTSGTYERGMRFRPKDNCTIIGINIPNDNTTLINDDATFKLYADAESPGGTTLLSYTPPTFTFTGTSPIPLMIQFPSASRVDLTAGTWYRFVVDWATNQTTPRKASITGSPNADLLASALPMGGDMYWTQEDTGAWVDDTAATPTMTPILVPNTDSAGSGSGGSFTFS